MKTPTKSEAALALGFLFVLLLSGVVSIVAYLQKDRTAGGGDGWSDAPAAWRLDPVPLMSVGDTETDPLFEVAGVVITENHIVIAQESTGTLRFYTHAGVLDTVAGGIGEGPGEFGSLQWMKRAGDHLFAYDARGDGISKFSRDGRLQSSIAVARADDHLGLRTLDVFSDGSSLSYAYGFYTPTPPAVQRLPRTLVLSDADGALVARLFDMAGPETWYEPFGNGGSAQIFRFFGRVTAALVIDSLVVVLENDSYDIPVYGRDGVVRDTLRPVVVPEPAPLPRDQVEFIREALLDSWDLGDQRGEVERMLVAMGMPESLPPYGWLSLGYPDRPPVTAVDGLVWALRYGGIPREGAEPDGPEWFVFEVGVGQIATLSSPDDVVLYDVAGDLAAVLRRTDLGEEIVELRRIVGR
ncbi:MAG: hypothetical protein F4Y07_14095 [Gemmatimonadetes bacterium]|nr:hypothetical protein [Gemmatimonadota bacterium]MYE17604.1 hypothetical protein [Gemmatimonadota bacterium]